MLTTNFLAGAAVLLSAATQVAAAGNAIIHNQCDFDVYLWSISNTEAEMVTVKANGGEYTEAYRVNPNGGGVSMKMGVDTVCRNITQFEYTYEGSNLWYDLSNIDGYPFAQFGVNVIPSDSTCRGVVCPAGTDKCAAAYNIPSDNFATAQCQSDADTVVVLCSYEEDTSESASVSSVAFSAVATAAPTTVAASSANNYASAVHTVWQHASYTAAPTTTAAPVVAQQNLNPNLVVETTFITHVVTVEARALPTPPASVEQRSERHGHRAAHDHPVKRHSHPHAPKENA